jgi:tyrosine-protein kinase
MELKNYLQILKRWIWLLLLCTLLGIASGYLASWLVKPAYQATTKILISKDLSDQNSQFAAMTNQQLIDAYVQLLSSASVVNEVSHRLNTEIDIQNIGQIQQVRTTPVIQIVIEDSDPQRAATIANMLVEVLIDQTTQGSGYASTEASLKNKISQVQDQISALQGQFNQISDEKLQSQLKQVNDQITTLQDQISKLSTEIGPLAALKYPTAEQSSQLAEKQAQLAQLQSQLNQFQQIRINLDYFGKPTSSSNLGDDLRLQLLQSTLDHYQTIYLDLVDNLQTVQVAHLRSNPTIAQIEKATPPTEPVRPRPLIYSTLAGIVGLVLAIGIVFISEYMDDTLKTLQDVQQALNIPVLGVVNMQPQADATKGFATAWQLNSDISEAINALRTNLEFTFAQSSLKTLLLLSVNESDEGKTSIATDLAVSYAQSDSRVILLDADLRNPSVHHYFGLANEDGFSDLLADDSKTEAVSKKVEDLDRLTVITGGNASLIPVPDGITLTRPNKIVKILNTLKKQSDVLIIVAPSVSIADSWVLASKVDGVLLVMQPRGTHPSEARHLLEQLHRAKATILGAVLYQVPHNLTDYYKRIRNNYRRS